MRILVTGGLGFIGSALIRSLVDKTDHTILNIDKCSYASMPEALEGRENVKNYDFEKIDITDGVMVNKIVAEFKPNKIFHLAAESHVDRSISGPEDFIQTNIIGTFNILESIRTNFTKLNEDFILVHVSTDEVFGSLKMDDELFVEHTPYAPNSPYSASKASSDLLARSWNKTYGIRCAITNCSNNYGPWQNPEKLIPKTIMNALTGKKIPIYGKGENIRDWLHVDDHVNALIKISDISAKFEKFNIGGNQEMSNINLVKLICSYLDLKMPSKNAYIDQIEYVNDRLGHDLRYAIDASKLSKELNFQPEYLLDDGIKSTLDWYIDNLEWVKSKLAI
ncbi:dTDP-glucose 4,6-dehydratase [Gammaproteobacteria bacterium]|nr:dTDP-glucose 4,6-dehydratase [Gammaproteobacteria bacterium]